MVYTTSLKLFTLIILTLCSFHIIGCGNGEEVNNVIPDPIEVHVDTLTISGSAVWPGAQTLEVEIDNVSVPVNSGSWSAKISFTDPNVTEKIVEISIIADSVLVAAREVLIQRINKK